MRHIQISQLLLVFTALPVGCSGSGPESATRPTTDLPDEAVESVRQLVSKADLVVLGTVQKVYDYTARDGGMGYDVKVEKVVKGYWTDDVLHFRSGGWIGYAKYTEGERVLAFLISSRLSEATHSELLQLKPITHVQESEAPGGLHLSPLDQYLELIADIESNPSPARQSP